MSSTRRCDDREASWWRVVRQAARRDDGGIELFVIIVVLAAVAALGLVVDAGGYLRAKDQAAWCAQQASRAGAGQLDLAQGLADGTPVVVGSQAVAAAQRAVAVGGNTGQAWANADGSVTVSCTVEYHPVVFTMAGTTTWSATEQGTARPYHGINQPQEP